MIFIGDDGEHLANLEEVLRRLQNYGIRANKAKCEFFTCKENIIYSGHDIDSNCRHKSAEKIEAVLKAPCPNEVAEVGSVLGLINYYHMFLLNLATAAHPLNHLLEKTHKRKWTELQRKF